MFPIGVPPAPSKCQRRGADEQAAHSAAPGESQAAHGSRAGPGKGQLGVAWGFGGGG